MSWWLLVKLVGPPEVTSETGIVQTLVPLLNVGVPEIVQSWKLSLWL
jgi:hypothetical protein